jgi:hypothetical protein
MSTDETDTLLVECIKLINRTATFGVGVSCDMQEVASLFPKTLPIFHRVYPMCCYLAMEMLSGIAKAHGYIDGIAYCFESGQQSEGLARIFIQKLVAVPEVGADLLHVSDSFASKNDVVQLQAADLIAWEWRKWWEESVERRRQGHPNPRTMRKSLIALLSYGTGSKSEYNTKRFHLTHLEGEPLRDYAEKIIALHLVEG